MIKFSNYDIGYYDIQEDVTLGKNALKTLKVNEKQLKLLSFPFENPRNLKSCTLFDFAKSLDINLIPSISVKTRTNIYVIYNPSKDTIKLIEQEYEERKSIWIMLLLEELNNIKCCDDFGEWTMVISHKKILDRIGEKFNNITIDDITEELLDEEYCKDREEAEAIINQIISKIPEEDYRIEDAVIMDIIKDEKDVYIAFPSTDMIEFIMTECKTEEDALKDLHTAIISALGNKEIPGNHVNFGFILDNMYDVETMRMLDVNGIRWTKGVRT